MQKILVLETDSKEFGRYSSLSNNSEYALKVVPDFDIGIKLFLKWRPDILIIKIIGLKADEMRKLKKMRETYPFVRLITVSAEADSSKLSLQEMGLSLKFDFFIKTPFTEQDLQAVVKNACAIQREGAGSWDDVAEMPAQVNENLPGTQAMQKILVVEDSKTAQKMYESFVKNAKKLENIKLEKAYTAEEGLRLLEKSTFPLIILDWELPGMSGLEFLEQVRANTLMDKIKIIMCTSVAQKPKILQAISLGVNDYIVKPVNQQVFIDKVHTNLNS